jgi:hypothetical protein
MAAAGSRCPVDACTAASSRVLTAALDTLVDRLGVPEALVYKR